MTIQILKLTTGEELIGDVTSKGNYEIKHMRLNSPALYRWLYPVVTVHPQCA
jgi:hypothetical protein